MPNQPKTPNRTMRVPDDLWNAVREFAEADGESMTVVVNRLLENYLADRIAEETVAIQTEQVGASHSDEQLVIADVRESYPDMTEQEALDHVYNTLLLSQIEGDDELALAFRRVITTLSRRASA